MRNLIREMYYGNINPNAKCFDHNSDTLINTDSEFESIIKEEQKWRISLIQK